MKWSKKDIKWHLFWLYDKTFYCTPWRLMLQRNVTKDSKYAGKTRGENDNNQIHGNFN